MRYAHESDPGSAQYYWLCAVWELGKFENPPHVQQVWWDKLAKCESQKSAWEDFRGVVLPFDHRERGPKEIIFDIDLCPPFRTQEEVRQANMRLHEGMERYSIPHFLTQTGGRGFHQHIFYESEMTRLELAKKILMACRMMHYFGDGKPVDPQPIGHARHMIRMIGGRKMIGPNEFHYKTWIREIPDEIVPVTRLKDVKYPEKVEIWRP